MLRLAGSARRALAGEVAIVTGASTGIGAATAHELSRRGATVVMAARREGALAAQAESVRAGGGAALAVRADVADPVALARLVERTTDAFGRVDVLVNNAGANWQRPLASSSVDDVVSLLRVNLIGTVLLTRMVLPGMLERRRGSVICVGSLAGRVAMEPVYSASKYGVRGFALALRRQLAGSGVSVSLVSPGNIDTAMTSHVRARMPKPGLVATKIADLVTDPRREVVVPRRHYAIAWLDQWLPTMADVTHRRRHWAPVEEGEGAWTS